MSRHSSDDPFLSLIETCVRQMIEQTKSKEEKQGIFDRFQQEVSNAIGAGDDYIGDIDRAILIAIVNDIADDYDLTEGNANE